MPFDKFFSFKKPKYYHVESKAIVNIHTKERPLKKMLGSKTDIVDITFNKDEQYYVEIYNTNWDRHLIARLIKGGYEKCIFIIKPTNSTKIEFNIRPDKLRKPRDCRIRIEIEMEKLPKDIITPKNSKATIPLPRRNTIKPFSNVEYNNVDAILTHDYKEIFHFHINVKEKLNPV